jgi:triacylglycerol lipase
MSQPFDKVAAVEYGKFVDAAYTMFEEKPAPPNPLQPTPNIPTGYTLVAWLNMADFFLNDDTPKFYGFIAQENANAKSFVVAIRGTEGFMEWWDDFQFIKTPFVRVPGAGSVATGFLKIYDTLAVVPVPALGLGGGPGASLPGKFSEQVAQLVHAAAALSGGGSSLSDLSSAQVVVTGHSLGSALCTLYVMENTTSGTVRNPTICTFASPRVGDGTFVAAFNALGLTSWRVVNKPDLVPNLPPDFFGYGHVNAQTLVDSTGKVKSTLGCAHAMATYLSMLDPTLSVDTGCAPAPEDSDLAPDGGGGGAPLGGGSAPTARATLQPLVEPLGHPSLTPLIDVFNQIGMQYQIDPCLLAAIAEAESSWNKLRVSFDGNYGRGLMQIDAGYHSFAEQNVVYEVPTRWVTGGKRTGKAVDVAASVANGALVFDAHENVRYACTALLGPAFAHFAGRADTEVCVIASYNAGVGGVDDAIARGDSPESATYDPNYVQKITNSYSWLGATSRANASSNTSS